MRLWRNIDFIFFLNKYEMVKILKWWEAKVESEWKEHLESKGVKLPTGYNFSKLACLRAHIGKAISHDEIAQWLNNEGVPYDRQARHLTDLGWDVRSGNSRFTRGVYDDSLERNQLKLHTISEPNPVWSVNNQKRINFLGAKDWNEILETFKDRGCSVCGTIKDSYDKGHLNREKPYEIGNIVPMCSNCNNWGQAKNVDFELDNFLVARPLV